jgi:hypothetical protein
MERKIDSTLHIRVEPELSERLLELARAEDRPLSNLIRRALRDVAARQAGQQASAAPVTIGSKRRHRRHQTKSKSTMPSMARKSSATRLRSGLFGGAVSSHARRRRKISN